MTQWNAYSYAQNSPISLSDPDGRRPMGAGDSGCSNCRQTTTKTKTGKVKHSWAFGNEHQGARSVYGKRYQGRRYTGGKNYKRSGWTVNDIASQRRSANRARGQAFFGRAAGGRSTSSARGDLAGGLSLANDSLVGFGAAVSQVATKPIQRHVAGTMWSGGARPEPGLVRGVKIVGRGSTVAGVVLGGYTAYDAVESATGDKQAALEAGAVASAANLAAGTAGMAIGTAVGSILPGPGNLIGAGLGFAIGFTAAWYAQNRIEDTFIEGANK